MTEVQEQIKSILESSFEHVTGEKIIVEYVTDVSARANEIQTQSGVNMRDVYEATQYTGVFIPATDNSCSYILIQEYRNDNLDIMTAFHEMQHAIEYIMLLNCIFEKNRQRMIDSSVYPTFQIYSEFSATRTGISKYLTFVNHSDMSQDEFANCLVDTYRRDYLDFSNITTRYQLVIHTMQYLGVLVGVKDVIKDFDLDSEIYCIKYLDEFQDIFDLLNSFAFNYNWFETFDKVAREFIR